MDTFPEEFRIENHDEIFSPGLLFFKENLEHNLQEMVRIAGDPSRLRPHVKTHKTREIVKMQVKLGITKHKCATIAEAEMLLDAGVEDIVIAYQLVGPNQDRLLKMVELFPEIKFGVLIDSFEIALSLSGKLGPSGHNVDAILDLNSGMDRTGIQPDTFAMELYEAFASFPGLTPGGLHWYDGHHRQPDLVERMGAVNAGWQKFVQFRNQLMLSGLPIPKVIAAGTGSFPILAEQPEPNLELSPGTTTLFDADMSERFPEQNFRWAVGILTRVVSKPGENRLTLDVGHKACAADQPAGDRLRFPAIPDAREVMQSEEHLVIETAHATDWKLGDAMVVIPRHACPTCAVHSFGNVIESGKSVTEWRVASRNRRLTL